MKIFVGDTRSKKMLKILQEAGIGRVMINQASTLYPGEEWIFDNGAYRYYTAGKRFDQDRFIQWYETAQEKLPTPYLAVVPDMVGGGNTSLQFSCHWRRKLRNDWPWYLALQDDMDPKEVIRVIDRFDGLFLGGTDEFKKTAGYWCNIAHHCKKNFHYGRCGTLSKIIHATIIQADSIDSTYPLWEMGRMYSFVQSLAQQTFDELLVFERNQYRGDGSVTQVRP